MLLSHRPSWRRYFERRGDDLGASWARGQAAGEVSAPRRPVAQQYRDHACVAPDASGPVRRASGRVREHSRRLCCPVSRARRCGAGATSPVWRGNIFGSATGRRLRAEDHSVHIRAAGSAGVAWEITLPIWLIWFLSCWRRPQQLAHVVVWHHQLLDVRVAVLAGQAVRGPDFAGVLHRHQHLWLVALAAR